MSSLSKRACVSFVSSAAVLDVLLLGTGRELHLTGVHGCMQLPAVCCACSEALGAAGVNDGDVIQVRNCVAGGVRQHAHEKP